MKRFAKIVILLTLLLVLVGVSIASAHNDHGNNNGHHRVVVRLKNATVPWEVPSLIGGPDEANYECSDIPAGLEIVPVDFGSDRRKVARINELRHGRTRIVVRDVVTGTAVDQNGTLYDFVYKNTATYTYHRNGVVRAKMVDTFEMIGGDVDYTVAFNWHWRYEAPNGIEVEKVYDGNTLVNLKVSPGPFPTDDGFTESPNIIPGSWQQILTDGFIFGCDPL